MMGTFLAKRAPLPYARTSPGLKDAAWLGNCWELSAARGRSSDAFGKHSRSGCGCGNLRGSIGKGQAVEPSLGGAVRFSAAEALG